MALRKKPAFFTREVQSGKGLFQRPSRSSKSPVKTARLAANEPKAMQTRAVGNGVWGEGRRQGARRLTASLASETVKLKGVGNGRVPYFSHLTFTDLLYAQP